MLVVLAWPLEGVWGPPPENFEISDAQRAHFMPSELNMFRLKGRCH